MRVLFVLVQNTFHVYCFHFNRLILHVLSAVAVILERTNAMFQQNNIYDVLVIFITLKINNHKNVVKRRYPIRISQHFRRLNVSQ